MIRDPYTDAQLRALRNLPHRGSAIEGPYVPEHPNNRVDNIVGAICLVGLLAVALVNIWEMLP